MSFYTIKEAIRGGFRLRLSLRDGEHVVEPHVLGRNRNGHTLLRAFVLRGPRRLDDATGWKLFRLDRIDHAVETGDRFTGPRPRYKPDDPTMSGGIIERL
jgi:predicted DNA-binding transcriptional regulator YafY